MHMVCITPYAKQGVDRLIVMSFDVDRGDSN